MHPSAFTAQVWAEESKNKMIITITLQTDDNELIAKETAYNFESAGESLGKLERFYAKSIPAAEEKLRKIDKDFAKNYPDSKVNNEGENNEYDDSFPREPIMNENLSE